MMWIKMSDESPPEDLRWWWVFDKMMGVTMAQWWHGSLHCWVKVYNTKEETMLPNVTHYREIDWPESPDDSRDVAGGEHGL